MKVSIKKISEVSGFSPATISNALNNKKGVNKETSENIFKIAKELGYVMESKISKIKFVIYKKNGSVVNDSPFFVVMLEGVEKECSDQGYEMVVCNLDSRSPDYEIQLRRILEDTQTAVILLGTELTDSDVRPFQKAKCPMVCIDYSNIHLYFDEVLINNFDSVQVAVEHLVRKGHTQIGYLKGSFRIKPFCSRESGFERAMKRHGLPIQKSFVFLLSPDMEGAHKDMAGYLEKGAKVPTAFFADNDMIALGAMKALQEHGYRIPQDVSIIGFDDLPFCEISSPRLTTIRVSKQDIGKFAVRRVIELIRNPSNTKLKIHVGTEFVERDSVRDLRADGKEEGKTYEKKRIDMRLDDGAGADHSNRLCEGGKNR